MLRWGPRYTQDQLDDAQARWSLRFPPDLIALYLEHRPLLGKGTVDWVETDHETIRDRLTWPLEGFWFDVQHNNVWWPEWGEKAERLEDQYDLLKTIVAQAPKLIPIFGHRYLPSEPYEAGNPVFSVYQTDVIYYGADLMDYLARETADHAMGNLPSNLKRIPFWTRAVERNNGTP